MTLKQRLGAWLIPRLPIGHIFLTQFRLELAALRSRVFGRLNIAQRARIAELRTALELLVNLGCGPFGKDGWVNIDLCSHPNVTLEIDCRRKLPLADKSCAGIHVEHFLEHLDPQDHQPLFLKECRRCLKQGGILRVIVPDAEAFVRAYAAPGWASMNALAAPGGSAQDAFPTKMLAINHVFVQGGEHHGGFDAQTLEFILRRAGFDQVKAPPMGGEVISLVGVSTGTFINHTRFMLMRRAVITSKQFPVVAVANMRYADTILSKFRPLRVQRQRSSLSLYLSLYLSISHFLLCYLRGRSLAQAVSGYGGHSPLNAVNRGVDGVSV